MLLFIYADYDSDNDSLEPFCNTGAARLCAILCRYYIPLNRRQLQMYRILCLRFEIVSVIVFLHAS